MATCGLSLWSETMLLLADVVAVHSGVCVWGGTVWRVQHRTGRPSPPQVERGHGSLGLWVRVHRLSEMTPWYSKWI